MHLLDWLIVALPLLLVIVIGLRTQKYVKGVADFLTAGRVAGRYVLCVASAVSVNFWGQFILPLILLG